MRQLGPDTKYTNAYFLRHAWLELTRECNLRCVYCGQSQPDFERFEPQPAMIEKAIRGLREHLIGGVDINGQGETTTLADWQKYLPALRCSHLKVCLTSNFARTFCEAEIDALAKLAQIAVSIDTDDARLLRDTRRCASLDTILTNIAKVRARARDLKIGGPKFAFLCVVHSLNVMHLDRFVEFGLNHGIREFKFCNLRRPPDLREGLNVDHVTALPPEQLPIALQKIDLAAQKAKAAGARFCLAAGLKESIENALQGECSGIRFAGRRCLRYSGNLKAAETRNCLDPWLIALIRADGEVRPCCFQAPFGSLKDHSLIEILNSASAAQLRQRLIRGDLDAYCQSCPERAAIPKEAFLGTLSWRVPRSSSQALLLKAAYRSQMVIREMHERLQAPVLGGYERQHGPGHGYPPTNAPAPSAGGGLWSQERTEVRT